MSALTETTSSPTLVGFPSHLTPSATFRPSQCNPSPKLERHLKKFGLNQLKWTSLMKPIRLKLPSFSLALFSSAQSCSLFGGSSSSHLLQLMNTALTMLVEPRLKQAIHLVSSEHQNSPPHCENVLNSYLLFSPLYIFLRSKNLSPTPCNLAARIVCILYSPF